MKKIVLYLFPRSSLIPPMSVPHVRKAALLAEYLQGIPYTEIVVIEI